MAGKCRIERVERGCERGDDPPLPPADARSLKVGVDETHGVVITHHVPHACGGGGGGGGGGGRGRGGGRGVREDVGVARGVVGLGRVCRGGVEGARRVCGAR